MTHIKTYGTVRHEMVANGSGRPKPHWIVTAEPHVAVRLKRVFARIDQGAQGEYSILDTPESARDLEWFLDRYPLDVAEPDRLRAAAARHHERESVVATILQGGRPSPVDLAVPLRDYQIEAVELALTTRGLLVADDVGLGKSAVGIGILSDPSARPAAVVTLTHLPGQWSAEFRKFAPSLDVYVAKTMSPEDELRKYLRRNSLFHPDVYILSYSKIAGWAPYLSRIIKGLCFDEVQELRRTESNKYRGAVSVALAAEVRVGLSATPIFNYGGEIYNVLDTLKPDAIGSREEFNREWCRDAESGKSKIRDPAAFGTYARAEGLMIRRTRRDVRRELPPISVMTQTVDADLTVLDKVGDAAATLARVILERGKEDFKGQRMQAAEELSWLLRHATGVAKAIPVAEFVRLLVEAGEPVLLYGWHREVYSLWESRLKEYKPAFYTGTETVSQKTASVRRFVKGETPILIMSLRSGAGVEGLQSACRTLVFGELDWSPAAHIQCIGRVHRDGQEEPVMCYFLVSDSGSDPIVSDVLGLKKQQLEGLRDPEGELLEALATDGGHIRRLAEAYLVRALERPPAMA